MNKLIERFHIDIAIYKCCTAEVIQKKKQLEKYSHISKSEIFRFLWMGAEITATHKEYLMDNYLQLNELLSCIREFREIYQRKNIPLLYFFIEKNRKSTLKKYHVFQRFWRLQN